MTRRRFYDNFSFAKCDTLRFSRKTFRQDDAMQAVQRTQRNKNIYKVNCNDDGMRRTNHTCSM